MNDVTTLGGVALGPPVGVLDFVARIRAWVRLVLTGGSSDYEATSEDISYLGL
jgi:hypothetical protein